MTGIIKKAVTVGLLVFLLGGMVAARGAYGQVYSATPSGAILRERLNFNDVEGHWAQGAIIRQVALGILDDREANRFSPEASATRLEVLQALLRLLGLEAQGR